MTASRRDAAPRSVVRPEPASVRRVDAGLVAAVLSLIGLLAVGGASIAFLSVAPGLGGDSGRNASPGASGLGGGIVGRPSPNPSVIITPPPEQRTDVRGTVLFVRTGNIWAASGTNVRQVSSMGRDSGPAWSRDGSTIYFFETRTDKAKVPYQGRDSNYTLDYPVLMRMAPDGTARTEIYNSEFSLGGGTARKWFTIMLQLDVSPDGRTLALVSDAPNPRDDDVTVSTLPVEGGKIQNLGVRQIPPLGHNDPVWSPDGSTIAFTYNNREGATGSPRIGLYSLATKRLRLLSGPGYSQPSWSPDGRYIAASRTTGKGRDIAVLRVSDGINVAPLTRDGNSFYPVWSPDGKQIAYLHVERQDIDLRLMTLSGDQNFGVTEDKAVTEDGSLDPTSRPVWYMPPELRGPPPSPSESAPGTTESASSPTR